MSRRRTGKIASLPKVLRDQVNVMLRDGVTYAAISSFLEQHDQAGINAENISHWFKGPGDAEDGSGFKDWLKEQSRLEDMRIKREFALDVVRENEGSRIHEAAVQIAASQIYEVITDLDPETIREKLKESPEQYSRLINALAKLSDQGLRYQRYKDEVKKALDETMGKSAAGVLTKEDIVALQERLKIL